MRETSWIACFSQEKIQRIKNKMMLDQIVIVKFSKKFGIKNQSLIEGVILSLQSISNFWKMSKQLGLLTF